MASQNDVTGDPLISKTSNNNYRSNYDKIFSKNKASSSEEAQEKASSEEEKKD